MYQQMIREEIARQGHIGVDPRHVEAYMRLGYSTLDGMSHQMFAHEVGIGVICVREDGLQNAEALAKTYGL
jgi:hypothetical protein